MECYQMTVSAIVWRTPFSDCNPSGDQAWEPTDRFDIVRSTAPAPTAGQARGSGLVVGGQQPVSNMSAYISRDHRFESGGDGAWSLVDMTDDSPDSLSTGQATLRKGNSDRLESHG